MNHTEAYLLRVRNTWSRRLAACVLAYLAAVFLGSVLSFLGFRRSGSPLSWTIGLSAVRDTLAERIRSAVLGQAIPVLCTGSLILSVFTMLCIPVSVLLCLFRGASLGCLAALAYGGRLSFTSDSGMGGIAAYLAATLAFGLLCGWTTVYSDALNHAHWAGESRYAASLAHEFFRSFFPLAGVFFLAGMTAQFLLM